MVCGAPTSRSSGGRSAVTTSSGTLAWWASTTAAWKWVAAVVGPRCVAARTGRVEIFRSPADADRLLGAEQLIARGELVRQTFEIGERRHVHEVRSQMQQQRRLDFATVDVVHGFGWIEQGRQRAERKVRRARDEHAELGPQTHGEQVHEGFLAAVGVEHDELAKASARDAPP
jgi:hypothetical protein